MKVCLVNSLYHPYQVGGAERSVQILAEALVEQGHQVFVITLGERDETHVHQGVKVYRIKLRNIYWPFGSRAAPGYQKLIWHGLDTYNPLMQGAIAKVLESEHPDVVHTNNIGGFSTAAWAAAKQGGYRLVHTLRDYYILCFRTTMFHNGVNCATQCTPCRTLFKARMLTSARPDAVVGISAHILQRHLDEDMFAGVEKHVIFNSYDAPVGWTHTGAPANTVSFGYIGRLAASKGLETLISAYRQAGLGSTAHLYIAGSGEAAYVNALKQSAAGLNVTFLGRTDVADFFGRVNFTVVPSQWHEPLGRVVLESYAFGVPVIAANTGALPEIVAPEETGLIFSSEQTLVDHLRQTAGIDELERERWTSHCLASARQNFSTAAMVGKYLDIYRGTTST